MLEQGNKEAGRGAAAKTCAQAIKIVKIPGNACVQSSGDIFRVACVDSDGAVHTGDS